MTLIKAARERRRSTDTLARDLEEQRALRGLNKRQFAELIGCSTPFLWEVLERTGNPSIDTLAQWAERLGLECRVVFSKREG